MIAQRIYFLLVLFLFACSWILCRSAEQQIRKAEATQARQIERILASE